MPSDMTSACNIRVSGVVQGVGFRPFVFRLAQANTLAGWVLNDESGVAIHVEGAEPDLQAFVRALRTDVDKSANQSHSAQIAHRGFTKNSFKRCDKCRNVGIPHLDCRSSNSKAIA